RYPGLVREAGDVCHARRVEGPGEVDPELGKGIGLQCLPVDGVVGTIDRVRVDVAVEERGGDLLLVAPARRAVRCYEAGPASHPLQGIERGRAATVQEVEREQYVGRRVTAIRGLAEVDVAARVAQHRLPDRGTVEVQVLVGRRLRVLSDVRPLVLVRVVPAV